MNIKKSLALFVLFLAIAISVYYCAAYCKHFKYLTINYSNYISLKVQYEIHKNKLSSEKYDLVFVGDSQIAWGVNPLVFGNNFGKVANLAFPGIIYEENYLKWIENKLLPRAVIVVGLQLGRFSFHVHDTFNTVATLDYLEPYTRMVPYVNDWLDVIFDKPLPLVQDVAIDNTFSCKQFIGNRVNKNKVECSLPSKDILDEGKITRLTKWVKRLSNHGFTVFLIKEPITRECLLFPNTQTLFTFTDLLDKFTETGAIFLDVTGNYPTFDCTHMSCDYVNEYSNDILQELNQFIVIKK